MVDPPPGSGPVLIVLSARDGERLREQALALAERIEAGEIGDRDLEDVSYTLMVGREAMKHRLAMVVGSVEELQARLRAFAAGDARAALVGRVEKRAAGAGPASGDSLATLARRWVDGEEIEAAEPFHGQRRRLHLPTYPFAREEYRPAAASTKEEDGGITLDPAAFYLRDHRVHSRGVLPGAMSLELVRAAYVRSAGIAFAAPVSLRQILWRQPAVVEAEPIAARVEFEPAAEGSSFRLLTGEDRVHVQGFVARDAELASRGFVDLRAVRSRCPEAVRAGEFYEIFRPSGIEYGPSFRAVSEVFAGSGEALARLRLPPGIPGEFALHPAMLDGAFQACAVLLRGTGPETAVPFALERLEVLGPTTAGMWVHVRELSTAGAVRKLDLDLADADGAICVRVRGFSLRTLVAPPPEPPSRHVDTQAYLARMIAEESRVAAGAISPEEPLEAYGLDSMMIGRLTDRLERDFGPLPKTLFFEYQTIEQLAGYFAKEHGGRPEPPAAPAAPGSAIAIIGLAGRYPGARNVAEFWENLARGRDSISEVPLSRWDHSLYYDPQRGPGKTNSKWGGFVEDADCFDPLFFNISPREAEFLDPQERIFLQCACEAIEDAGYTRATLAPGAAPMAGGNERTRPPPPCTGMPPGPPAGRAQWTADRHR